MFKKFGLGLSSTSSSNNSGSNTQSTSGSNASNLFIPQPDYLPPQMEIQPEIVKVTINKKVYSVPSKMTILEACSSNGIYVPTLCHYPNLPPTGRCGVCLVQVEGRDPPLVQSCKTNVRDGMVITTNSPEIVYQQRIALKEFLGNKEIDAFSQSSEIEDLIKYIKSPHTMNGTNGEEDDGTNTNGEYSIVRNQDLCVLCTRCVRACSNIQNMNILEIDTDHPLQPITFEGNLPIQETDCISCGQCTVVCPTGAVAERSDIDVVDRLLRAQGADRKIMIVQTAPAARLSLGETLGDAPGECVDPKKAVAAMHAIGFDFVFDTCFGADMTALLEAEELAQRLKDDGPWPMFTSCCPAWVELVELSPVMMLGTMIRKWMEHSGRKRDDYFVVTLVPCTAKKEEIIRTELRDPVTNRQDVDIALTVREMGAYLKARRIDWGSLPGAFSGEYDEPFGACSGGGAIFGASGGVTEAALRVAYSIFTKELPDDPKRELYAAVRQDPRAGAWVEADVDVTPGAKRSHVIDTTVVSGTRAIQQFLESLGLDKSLDDFKRKDARIFVECMACPGGCIGGGGQPHSLDKDVLAKRRAAIHTADLACKSISAKASLKKLSYSATFGMSRRRLSALMEYDPPLMSARRTRHKPLLLVNALGHGSATASGSSSESGSGIHYGSESGAGGRNSSSYMRHTDGASGTFGGGGSGGDVPRGTITVLYGSQAGFTAAHAKTLGKMLRRATGERVRVISMDQFPVEGLRECRTLVLLTSTWESDVGLMPINARLFWAALRALPLEEMGSMLLATRFAVCGFGSTRYREFCGFAAQLHDALVALGAQPILGLRKIDVSVADSGNKDYAAWYDELLDALTEGALPAPRYLMVPSITPGGRTAPHVCARGFLTGTVTRVVDYKGGFGGNARDKFFYIEFSTGKQFFEAQQDQYVYIVPANPAKEVESLVNAIYPGMLNTAVSVLSINGADNGGGSSAAAAAAASVSAGSAGGAAGGQGGGGQTHQGQRSIIPPHLTIRQLFTHFIELGRRPTLWFVQALAALLDGDSGSGSAGSGGGSSSGLSGGAAAVMGLREDALESYEQFRRWVDDKTYMSTLRQCKGVVPSIEVLVSMLPQMRPRPYTPICQEYSNGHTVGLCVKLIPGGLCSNYLHGLKRGDKIMYAFGPSDFSRPNDAFFGASAGDYATSPQNSGSPSTSAPSSPDTSAISPINSPFASPRGIGVTLSPISLGPTHSPALKVVPDPSVAGAAGANTGVGGSSSSDGGVVPLERFPLEIRTEDQSGGSGGQMKQLLQQQGHQQGQGQQGLLFREKVAVDITRTETIEIVNGTKTKYRYEIKPIVTPKFRLVFEPSTGVIKPKFCVAVRASLTANCTVTADVRVPVGCEPIGRHSSALKAVATEIPVLVDSKLSTKIDFDEVRVIESISGLRRLSHAQWRGQDVALRRFDVKAFASAADFAAECQAIQDLRCPYIAKFIGYCALSIKKLAILTEYLPLGPLSAYIHTDKLSPRCKVKIALDCVKGLSYIHHCDVIHRALSPTAVLLVSLNASYGVSCKISNFGFDVRPSQGAAKDNSTLSGDGSGNSGGSSSPAPALVNLTTLPARSHSPTTGVNGASAGLAVGGGMEIPVEMVPYTAPEIFTGGGSGHWTRESDMFAYGMVLLELFSGAQLFEGAEDARTVADIIVSGKRPAKLDVIENKAVKMLVKKCVAQDPTGRLTAAAAVNQLTEAEASMNFGVDDNAMTNTTTTVSCMSDSDDEDESSSDDSSDSSDSSDDYDSSDSGDRKKRKSKKRRHHHHHHHHRK